MGCCCAGDDDDKNQNMAKSPMKKNVCCTDIIFLFLFIVFWAGMVYVAVYSVMQGDALRLVYGYDTFGNTCNRGNNVKLKNFPLSGQDTTGKTKVFFMDFQETDLVASLQICVEKCPDKNLEGYAAVQKWCQDNNVNLCGYDVKISEISLPENHDKCPRSVDKSISLLNRCVPDYFNLKEDDPNYNLTRAHAVKAVDMINVDELARKVLSDLYQSWKEMLALCFIALGVALIMVFLIRYVASVMVYVIVLLAAIACIAGTAFLWWTWWQDKTDLDKTNLLSIPLLDVQIDNEMAFLVFAIVATVLTVILLLILFVMRSRLALVVALFHEAGKFFVDIPVLLIQPIWTFFFLIIFLVYWIVILAYITTADQPTSYAQKRNPSGYTNETVDYMEPDPVRYMWWYHLVGLIWTSEFILACQQIVVSGSVAMWYFSRNKKGLSCTVCSATKRLILHHIGSVAFGAFIITLVKIPRYILMYIQQKCKGSDGTCAQCCLKCCICGLYCLECCLKFLNQNAYTIVMIEGKSFCSSAKRAFEIIASNALRVAAINSVGDFVLFLGKIGVTAITACIGVLWFKGRELNFYAIPVLIISVFAFLIAHCFLSIYEMVVDTLLLCFCEDQKMNDGTEGREYFMSKSLMKFVSNSDEALKNLDEGRTAKGEAREDTVLREGNKF